MDILDRIKYQEPFDMDQICLRMFLTGQNFKYVLAWTKGPHECVDSLSIVLKVHKVDWIWNSSHLLFFPPIHSTNKCFKNLKLELTILLLKIFIGALLPLGWNPKSLTYLLGPSVIWALTAILSCAMLPLGTRLRYLCFPSVPQMCPILSTSFTYAVPCLEWSFSAYSFRKPPHSL